MQVDRRRGKEVGGSAAASTGADCRQCHRKQIEVTVRPGKSTGLCMHNDAPMHDIIWVPHARMDASALLLFSRPVGNHTQVTVRLGNEANEFVFEPSVINLTAGR